MTKTTLTTVLAAVVALTAVPPAFAASPDDTVTCKISTAGLDLRTTPGARAMLRRIETAASAVCGTAPYSADLNAAHEWETCVSRKMSQAVTQLGSPMVSEAAHQPSPTQTASNGH